MESPPEHPLHLPDPGYTPVLPTVQLLVGLMALFVGWAVVLIIDVLAVLPLQTLPLPPTATYPLAWYHLFGEAGPIEKLQWLNLALAMLAAAYMWLAFGRSCDDRMRRAWFLLSAGLLLMLAEDSLNVRHVIAAEYVIPVTESVMPSSAARAAWELTFYAVLTILMAAPLLIFYLHGSAILRPPKRLIAGYALYGAVGFGSALRRLGDWQERLGHWIIDTLHLTEQPAWASALLRAERALEQDPDYPFTAGYLLVDHLIEESVELIAATLLLSGLLVLVSRFKHDRHTKPA